MKRDLFRVFVFTLALMTLIGSSVSAEMTTNVADIAKHGNLKLDITGEDLFSAGYEYGDLLEVNVLNQTWEVPFGSNYSDVDTGIAILRAENAEDVAVLAINMGDFATAAGIAVKAKIDEEPGYRWDYLVEKPVRVSIGLKQEDGYREQWLIHQLIRTDERADYPHLSDADFANFRVIDTEGMGENKLYRSSSPINPEIGRSAYADAAAKEVGIVTIINLADASNTYEGTENAHYQSCNVVYLNLGMDFTSEEFKAGLAEGMRFIIEGEAPFLLHCNEGKDRAGFASALLECLMGASVEEVVDDYMESYVGYYGAEKDTEKYNAVVNSNIVKTLNEAFGVENIYEADLAAEAKAFMIEQLGMTDGEVSAIREKLGKGEN